MPQLQQILSALETHYAESWTKLREIQAVFARRGFSLFLVGGAVRNLVLGQTLKDFDLASDALPQDVIAMFRQVIPTGLQHGTVTLVYKGEHFEITTFRVDGDYTDARRPDSVAFTPDIAQDLKRRDFTINAMALDLGNPRLLDPHGGQADLQAGIIRTVGDPLDRFAEDGLRIVRGIRFAAQLRFHLELTTYQAMQQRLDRLEKVSIERFRDELLKTLSSGQPSRGLYLLRDSGVLKVFLPELAALSEEDFAQTALLAELCEAQPIETRLATLLVMIDQELAKATCVKLKLSNQSIKYCLSLLAARAYPVDADWGPVQLRQFAAALGREQALPCAEFLICREKARDWLQYNYPRQLALRATTASQSLEFATEATPPWLEQVDGLRAGSEPRLDHYRDHLLRVLSENPPLTIGDLDIRGDQLIQAGIPAGKKMGIILEGLLEKVLEKPERNTYAWLLTEAKRLSDSLV